MAKPIITLERLKEVLSYDPETGIFTWLKPTSKNHRPGSITGSKNVHGYMCIGVDGPQIHVHRLAWFYIHGVWPAQHIDHVDGNKINNKFTNLREASSGENQQNRKLARRDSKIGLMGVSATKNFPMAFRAKIRVQGKVQQIGVFRSVEEAHAAYLAAKRRLHPFSTL